MVIVCSCGTFWDPWSNHLVSYYCMHDPERTSVPCHHGLYLPVAKGEDYAANIIIPVDNYYSVQHRAEPSKRIQVDSRRHTTVDGGGQL